MKIFNDLFRLPHVLAEAEFTKRNPQIPMDRDVYDDHKTFITFLCVCGKM